MMKDKALVSIITPCFNGEKYVKHYLESVLMQTYENIELIFVDDGSTDNTKQIVEEYEKSFAEKGLKLIYIYQENQGQAAAINQGLAIFNGNYLMWVDSDDILLERNVEEKVKYLEKHPECGLVLCEGEIVDAEALDKPVGTMRRVRPQGEDKLFEDLLLERNVVFFPGVIMARREAVLEVIPTRHIYESTQGQNWQLMLPLAYYYKCGYIEEVLFRCVAHDDSHSRTERTPEQNLQRIYGFIDLLTYTIKEMGIPEEKEILQMIRVKYAHRILRLSARRFGNEHKELTKQQYKLLKETKNITYQDLIFYALYSVKVLFH